MHLPWHAPKVCLSQFCVGKEVLSSNTLNISLRIHKGLPYWQTLKHFTPQNRNKVWCRYFHWKFCRYLQTNIFKLQVSTSSYSNKLISLFIEQTSKNIARQYNFNSQISKKLLRYPVYHFFKNVSKFATQRHMTFVDSDSAENWATCRNCQETIN